MVTSAWNTHLWAIVALAALLLPSAATNCRADDAADVKQALVDFIAATNKGDMIAARAFLTAEAERGQFGAFVDRVIIASIAYNQYVEAAAAKFGKEVPPADEKPPLDVFSSKLPHITFDVHGDDAANSDPRGDGALKLTKVAGAWKIVQIGDPHEWNDPAFNVWKKVAGEITQEIKDGKYASRAEAWSAFKVRRGVLEPATQPAR